MEASRLTVGQKTYDLNHLTRAKKTNLRRKLVIEHIESKPAGEIIRMSEFQQLMKEKSSGNAYGFINRMIRDGVISRYEGDRPKSYYYAVTGSVRVHKPKVATDGIEHASPRPPGLVPSPNISQLMSDLNKMGLKFTITISNEAAK